MSLEFANKPCTFCIIVRAMKPKKSRSKRLTFISALLVVVFGCTLWIGVHAESQRLVEISAPMLAASGVAFIILFGFTIADEIRS